MFDSDYDVYEKSSARPIDYMRAGVGLVARFVFWICVWFIVGNAVAQAITDGSWVLAFLELALFPLTFLVYPFVADPFALAWPFADGTNLVPFLVAALIAYPISTVIGGLDPVDR